MEFAETINATDFIWLAGLILFACWLLDTSLGTKALTDSMPRRNSMPPYLPLVPLMLWFGGVAMAVALVQKLTPGLLGWQKIFRDHLVMSTGAVVTMAVMMFLAHVHFARRLKGFGLNIRTIVKDFFMAIVNLLAAWPLMMAAITMTMFVAELIWGAEYQMQQHQQLEMITEYPQLPLRIMIVFVAVVIAPVLEEMLFRGFVQTTIRSFFGIRNSAWPAIAASSVFFAIMHADPGHWPALFVLGVCLGYSYEKSGSLFRPIFIHLFFNATSIIGTLSQ
ncbi:MAG TPA: CPBP family intramembrane glutamic endopeptidase [Sedimentisphaerales bacterium]|nr:CPBP family intramembrane glutamic endopeptidase [Sedimentisphaerales bacterium]